MDRTSAGQGFTSLTLEKNSEVHFNACQFFVIVVLERSFPIR